MLQESNQKNIIFSTIILLSKTVNTKEFIAILFKCVYILELILIFWIITHQDHWISTTFLDSGLLLLIILVSFFILLVIQMGIVLLWKFQIQLYCQLLLFRYGLYPILALLLCLNFKTASFFTSWISIILLLPIVAPTYMV